MPTKDGSNGNESRQQLRIRGEDMKTNVIICTTIVSDTNVDHSFCCCQRNRYGSKLTRAFGEHHMDCRSPPHQKKGSSYHIQFAQFAYVCDVKWIQPPVLVFLGAPNQLTTPHILTAPAVGKSFMVVYLYSIFCTSGGWEQQIQLRIVNAVLFLFVWAVGWGLWGAILHWRENDHLRLCMCVLMSVGFVFVGSPLCHSRSRLPPEAPTPGNVSLTKCASV